MPALAALKHWPAPKMSPEAWAIGGAVTAGALARKLSSHGASLGGGFLTLHSLERIDLPLHRAVPGFVGHFALGEFLHAATLATDRRSSS